MVLKPAMSVRTRIIALESVLLIACLGGLHYLSITSEAKLTLALRNTWTAPVLTLSAGLVGIALVRTITAAVVARATDYLGSARVRSVRSVLSIVLYVLLAVTVASQTQVDLSGIALSGAVTGVIIGIAAQASIANVVAGLVILFSRPFRAGQFVTVRAAAFAGSEYSGEVGEITLFYTTLFAGKQEIRVPNSSMVTSVVTLRPQVLDVYMPVILPPSRWESFSTADLSRQLAASLPPHRAVSAAVERIDTAGIQIGVRASVSDEDERSKLERTVIRLLGPDHVAEDTGTEQVFS